ncbi:hypothetical protein GCM10011575_17730 [Microlunatus endophyticus]|uniref:Uncharacterized protein n=1 Tax=Microlunatus endophyticus TaxID=1716077 RepID=A0A917S689_9ACTN|nr:hypothetical protein [Microlunatus endophyticus]GGL59596.1 hypothetical protein GCM10011575_17730 [Microlunatus endophyticus]
MSRDQTEIDEDRALLLAVRGRQWTNTARLLVLPTGWSADVDRLSIGWGSASVKVPSEPDPGKPLVLVHGAIGAGRVRLRTPNRRDRRIARRSTR